MSDGHCSIDERSPDRLADGASSHLISSHLILSTLLQTQDFKLSIAKVHVCSDLVLCLGRMPWVEIVLEDGSGVAIDWVTGLSYSERGRGLNVQSGLRKGRVRAQ